MARWKVSDNPWLKREGPGPKRYTDKQRAAYWKKKYFDLRRRMKNW